MKKVVMVLFLLIFSLSFSMTKEKIEKERKRDRLETIENVRELSRSNEKELLVMTTLFTSDIFLEEASKYNKPFNVSKVMVIFPEIEYVEKYLPKVSTLIKNIEVYILDGEVDEEYLQGRDYEDYVKRDLTSLLRKYFNVSVIKVDVSNEDIPKLVEDSFTEDIRDKKSVINKYFFNKNQIK